MINFNNPSKKYNNLINQVNELNKEISKYKFRELIHFISPDTYEIYLNKLHKDIRDKMKNYSFIEAIQFAHFKLDEFKKLQIELSCIKNQIEQQYSN